MKIETHKQFRIFKLEKFLKKEISIIINQDLRDPRLRKMYTISKVKLSYDFSYAKIFLMYLEKKKEENINFFLKILQNSSGFIRQKIGKRISIRCVPKLFFIYDFTYLRGIKISNIVKKVLTF